MLPWMIVSGLVVLFMACLAVSAEQGKAAAQQARQDFLRRHEGWDGYVQAEPMGIGSVQSVVAVNHDSREVVLGTTRSLHRYPWFAIASVETVQNGHAVTSVDRGSQLMGAAIGGVIAGDAGMIAGGSSGRSTTRERVCELGLKVVVDDRETPVHTVFFLHSRNGVFSGSEEYRRVAQVMDHFHALLVNAMRSEQLMQAPPAPALSHSMTGELERLWRLKELGALTDAQFLIHKGALVAPVSGPAQLP